MFQRVALHRLRARLVKPALLYEQAMAFFKRYGFPPTDPVVRDIGLALRQTQQLIDTIDDAISALPLEYRPLGRHERRVDSPHD